MPRIVPIRDLKILQQFHKYAMRIKSLFLLQKMVMETW